GCRIYGTRVCAPGGGSTVCEGQIPDIRAEVCNGKDDDCDGAVDNLTGTCGIEAGACHAGARGCGTDGHEICDGATTPGDELCNGVDDDCDGKIDEGFDLGVPCAVGVGACRRTGMRVCAPGGVGTVCGAQPGAPA